MIVRELVFLDWSRVPTRNGPPGPIRTVAGRVSIATCRLTTGAVRVTASQPSAKLLVDTFTPRSGPFLFVSKKRGLRPSDFRPFNTPQINPYIKVGMNK